jgi:HK97 family phage major capsid protein
MKKLEKNVKSVADNLKSEIIDGVSKGLGLEDLKKTIAELSEKMTAKEVDAIEKVYIAKDLQKDVSELKDSEHVKAFMYALVKGDEATIKTLTEGTDADGGYLVSDQVHSTLEREMEKMEDFRNLVRVINMSKWKYRIPVELTQPQFTATAEGATKSTTSMTFYEKYLTAKKKAAILYLSDEFIEDADFNMTQIVTQSFAQSALEEVNRVIVDGGGGATDGDGLMNNTSIGVTATVGSLNWSKVNWLVHKVPTKFRVARNDCVFLVGSDVKRIMMGIVDGNNRPLWTNGNAQVGVPDQFMGYRVVESSDIVAGEMLFGNTKHAAWYGQRQPMTVKFSDDTTEAFTKDKTAIRVVMRHDQQIVWPRACYKYTGVTA